MHEGADENLYLNRTERLFLKGFTRIEKDLDIANLLLTTQKLKAGMSALIANDKRLMDKTKAYFYSGATIYSDTEEENDMRTSNKFMQFLEQDDRNTLLQLIADGDIRELAKLDANVTDKMRDTRLKIKDVFRMVFVRPKKHKHKNNCCKLSVKQDFEMKGHDNQKLTTVDGVDIVPMQIS